MSDIQQHAMLTGLFAVFSLQVFVWALSVYLKDASIVDRFWGLIFIVGATVSALSYPFMNATSLLSLGLVWIWGIRLSLHIHLRNRGHGEDFRYQAMRSKNPRWFWLASLVTIFLFQGVISLVIGLPVYWVIFAETGGLSWLCLPGALICISGILCEATADYQLRRFKKTNTDSTALLDTGLWKYSRHPNYLGEIITWWGFWLLACTSKLGFVTVISPLLITVLLVRITGVTMLEKKMRTKKPGFAQYANTTPAIFPRLSSIFKK